MNFLDMRTVLISYAISNLICTIVLFSLWRQNRTRFSGMDLWWANFGLSFTGMVFLALRGIIPDILSVTVANLFLVSGTILLLIGLERFLGKRRSQIHNYIILALYLGPHLYFTYLNPSLVARNLIVTTTLLVISIQAVWLMLKRVDSETRLITRGTGYVALLFCIFAVSRILLELVVSPGLEFIQSNLFETIIHLGFQMVNIALAFSLYLMVNRRLNNELESDITIRTDVEAELRLSEEKFSKAFRSSPDAVLITRVSDGHYIEVNDGFTRLTGYTWEESLASSSIAKGLWVDLREREKIIKTLREHSRVHDFESIVRIKSGKLITILVNGELINIHGEECALWVIRDITESKRTEAIIQLRLSLWEYSTTHTAQELMQKALDEIEMLTGSMIGFYHFVDEDQNNLVLQAWSTRTSQEFCKTDGEGMHYPIDEAGVWVDCAREKRPVIHNDYSSLPNRRGLPDGHAEVVRELVVPILRNDRVVSILGVGNKPTDYDEKDVELVSYIANMVWEIVEHNRANEQIRSLNTQLENLAMIDDLTGLTNRRAFFIKGVDEVNKTKRYNPPLSVIMLDIDRFKNINDTYGHEAGDQALQCMANILLSHIRVVDVAARLGGEEFAILLPSTTAASAAVLAERLRVAIQEKNCTMCDDRVNLTASFGVAEYSEGMQNLDDLLRAADTAMYQAKNNGRNQVVVQEM